MMGIKHFYPRSPCGERRDVIALMTEAQSISIHALLAESDCIMTITTCIVLRFLSTLSLRRATQPDKYNKLAGVFLSTLSLRRATGTASAKGHSDCNFYPRSPCGERRGCGQYCIRAREISIHALLAESDSSVKWQFKRYINISIHALLAESDSAHFYTVPAVLEFLSTLSLRRATRAHKKKPMQGFNFYPRSPCGERHEYCSVAWLDYSISIHALLAESDT